MGDFGIRCPSLVTRGWIFLLCLRAWRSMEMLNRFSITVPAYAAAGFWAMSVT
jgi:hypothetical protein